MVKIIAFTGPQGTGKTTMRCRLVVALEERGFKVQDGYYGILSSISREAADLGFTINQGSSFKSQMYMVTRYMNVDIATRQFCEKNKIDYMIVDRSIIDTIAYAKLGKMKDEEKYHIERIVMDHFDKFPVDMLVYCEILDVLVGDEHRSTDRDYQFVIDRSMRYTMNKYDIGDKVDRRWLPKGTIDERLEKLVNWSTTKLWRV